MIFVKIKIDQNYFPGSKGSDFGQFQESFPPFRAGVKKNSLEIYV